MYESITYAELKSLPREQKIEALKELMATCPSQKKIAEKLGVNPPNIYSMISRYIRDDEDKKTRKKRGRLKGKGAANKVTGEQEIRQEQTGSEVTVNELPEADECGAGQVMEAVSVIQAGANADPGRQDEQGGENDFVISIEKVLTGEELGSMLSAIGSALLKSTEYRIFMRITEK